MLPALPFRRQEADEPRILAQGVEVGVAFEQRIAGKPGAGRVFQPIRFTFRKNSTELVFAHRDQSLAGTHQVRAVEMISRATGPRRDVKDDYSAGGMSDLLNVHILARMILACDVPADHGRNREVVNGSEVRPDARI